MEVQGGVSLSASVPTVPRVRPPKAWWSGWPPQKRRAWGPCPPHPGRKDWPGGLHRPSCRQGRVRAFGDPVRRNPKGSRQKAWTRGAVPRREDTRTNVPWVQTRAQLEASRAGSPSTFGWELKGPFVPGGYGRLSSLPSPHLPDGRKLAKRWGGAQGGPWVSSNGGQKTPASGHGHPRWCGERGRGWPQAPPSLPLLPRRLEEGKEQHGRWEGPPRGPRLPVSTKKSDAVQESWKQAAGTGGCGGGS